MKILQANQHHLDGIFKMNKLIDYGNPDEFMLNSIEEGRILVACDSNMQVIGYLLYQIIWGNSLFLSLLKVLPEFQRRGVGAQLLSEFEKNIKELGFQLYYSSTGLDNELAQNFHNKEGFKRIGTLSMDFGDELFYMKHI